ncbi:CGNR zinc finger domain-containing protein [Actinoplanes sp. NPDC051411]|uniref:CGNR zinc finger domain-containing protein n=1 Tax=Actinoplanes sp. NPDC051411 TaxID=3155522 RepID=UPI00343ECD71
MDECPPAVCASSDLVISFVNSGEPGWLTARTTEPVGPADVAAADELRERLVILLREHSNCVDDPAPVEEARAYLRRIAPRYPLVPVLSAGGCSLVPAQTGVPGLFGQLLAAVADLSYRGAWSRVKVCKNRGCHRGFFDKTRNTSGLYCGPACGSQAAMRAYRSRQKVA